MKRWFSIALIIVVGVILGAGLIPMSDQSGMDWVGVGQLPVQTGGRIKPLDALARQSLLSMRGKQSVRLPEGGELPAIVWFMEVGFRQHVADTIAVFRIDNDEVLGLMGMEVGSEKYFSFKNLEPYLVSIDEQARKIVEKKEEERSVFEKKLLQLHESLTLYHELIHTFRPLTQSSDMLQQEYAAWLALQGSGMAAIQKQAKGEAYDGELMKNFVMLADRYLIVSKLAKVRIIPAAEPDWSNVGQGLLDVIKVGQIDSVIMGYMTLGLAYEKNDPVAFNDAVKELQQAMSGKYEATRVKFEYYFNAYEPFYRCIILYVIAFLLIGLGWLRNSDFLLRAGFWMVVVTFAVHTLALIGRIYIMQRPPVTNLYSSAIFVGWIAVLIGLWLERMSRQGLGSAVASIVGFATLIVAHQLAVSGDTLEMVRAVLDSNFWLSTHVVTVTIGYSAMFLAGMLGAMALIERVIKRGLSIEKERTYFRMVFGVVCFALLFSFVGTMLGGIWADQSWGRFWGWDPKENGALLIVLWNAIVLHALIGKWIGFRGLMVLAVGGNIITSWSWFGTNMLGVGLHSYGFMESAFMALMAFILIQLIIMGLGWIKRSGQEVKS